MNKRRVVRIATIGAAIFALATLSSPAYAASGASPNSVTQKTTITADSSPAGGHSVVHITWKSKASFDYDWQNYDTAADGAGAIMYFYRCSFINGSGQGEGNCTTVAYDHDTTGNGTSDYSSGTSTVSAGEDYIFVQECNGGSQYSPNHCGKLYSVFNPAAG